MSKELIIIDNAILAKITNPKGKSEETYKCNQWFLQILTTHQIYISEITDYETRRKLIHLNNQKSIERLNNLIEVENIDYICITTEIMHKAAELWGLARQKGILNAPEKSLDADIILVATAIILSKREKKEVIIVTGGDRDIKRHYTNTKNWNDPSWNIEYPEYSQESAKFL